MKIITCINAAGERLRFPAGKSGEPFLLTDASGVLETKADLLVSDSALADGTTWYGARMQKRNIVLTLRDKPAADHRANRAALFSLFRFKQKGTLVFADGEDERQIEYVVESVEVSLKKRPPVYTVSLLCPSPFWQSTQLTQRSLGGTVASFVFPHVFPAGGEPFSGKSRGSAFTVENPGASDEIGLAIVLRALNGPVTNPRIYHLESGERMELGSATDPLVIPAGSSVTITTAKGDKRILSQEGESLAAYLSEGSDFLRIRSGKNTFSVGAESGDAQLSATFSWRFFYEGA